MNNYVRICGDWLSCDPLSLDKYNIVDISFMNTIKNVNSPISADMMSAGAINDVLCMRDLKNTNFTSDKLNQLISFFCLDN